MQCTSVYLKLAIDLKNNGFIMNSYDPCVAKKMVKGEAMTLVWNVDNIKVSHKDLFEVTKFSQYLFTIYGNKLKVHSGNIHNYLGIYLDYSEIGLLKVSMIKYIQKVLDKFPEKLRGTSATLVADHTLQVRGEYKVEFLEEDWADMFHQ